MKRRRPKSESHVPQAARSCWAAVSLEPRCESYSLGECRCFQETHPASRAAQHSLLSGSSSRLQGSSREPSTGGERPLHGGLVTEMASVF